MKGHKKYFKKLIAEKYPESEATMLAKINREFEIIRNDKNFPAKSKNPMDARMGIAAYFLATIKVLDKAGENFENIRLLMIEIAREYVRPKNKFQAFMKKIPAKFVGSTVERFLLKKLDRKFSHLAHPEGFVAKIITNKEETLGFGFGVDILECGICKLYQRHDYGKFASVLCEVDYITTQQAGLKMYRTGTIATGAKKCDFRYTKIQDSKKRPTK